MSDLWTHVVTLMLFVGMSMGMGKGIPLHAHVAAFLFDAPPPPVACSDGSLDFSDQCNSALLALF